MVAKSKRTYKYGDQPIRAKTVQVVQEQFGGAATSAQVDEYLKSIYPDYGNNTLTNLIVNSVNCKRSNWSFNRTARRTDDLNHRHNQYDRLFKRGNIFEIYNPSIHGVFELYEDENGNWLFRKVRPEFEVAVESATRLSTEERKEVLSIASTTPDIIEVVSRAFKRNPYVVAEVLIRAKGKCQNCKQDAPFKRVDGSPFLEVHHIEWLSHGGDDSVENAIALCPNCHRQAHYGELELLPVNCAVNIK
ncbi:HNH endonuclease [Citrobacter portucalensis]|uniref:HNH endonuclease n=1 Tax=Citrobacter portucalensis TaxID=1639133 RepID=UPI000F6EB9E2|nr:HNH endonuclease [Citrobacter portucalensis]NHR83729.1 HNH endonuclease [Citrobacter portucalensis]VEC18202.1 HNH endonuclease [Citrobacter portucalensis]